MKWGKKKPSSNSSSNSNSSPFSSRVPFLSRVLPSSWLSKFKRTVDTQPKPSKENFVGSYAGEGRFHARDNDAFWRLPFEPDDELGLGFLPSSCQRCGSDAGKAMEAERIGRFGNGIAWNVKEMKGFRTDAEILPGEKATLIKTPQLMPAEDLKFRQRFEEAVKEKRLRVQRNKSDAEQKLTKSDEKFTSKVEAAKQTPYIGREKLTGNRLRKHDNLSSVNSKTFSLTTKNTAFVVQNMKESYHHSPESLSFEWQNLKEVKMKSEGQRKSLYMSRESPRRRSKQTKVRAFSPKTPSKVETCKIKALEDMKKAKLKMKASKQRRKKESTSLENFAVEKRSLDPEKDFRDSMAEMIMEEKITRPKELEELLACYLTLNSHEFHDLIIKAFRQVWFDLDQASFEPSHTELHSDECFQD